MDSIGQSVIEGKFSNKAFNQPEDIRQLNEFKRFYNDSEQSQAKINSVIPRDENIKKQNLSGGEEKLNKLAQLSNNARSASKNNTVRPVVDSSVGSTLGKGNSTIGLMHSKTQMVNSAKVSLLSTYKPVSTFSKQEFSSSEVRFTLQSKGEVALIIRGYKKGIDSIVNWVISKAGAILDSLVINGKKLYLRVGK